VTTAPEVMHHGRTHTPGHAPAGSQPSSGRHNSPAPHSAGDVQVARVVYTQRPGAQSGSVHPFTATQASVPGEAMAEVEIAERHASVSLQT
jgi:hypothetical protein